VQDAHQADQLLTIKKEQDVMDHKIIEDMKQKKQARHAMASGKPALHDSVKSTSHEALPEVSLSFSLSATHAHELRGANEARPLSLSLSLLSVSLLPSLPPSIARTRSLYKYESVPEVSYAVCS
jgi:hypothetical protein